LKQFNTLLCERFHDSAARHEIIFPSMLFHVRDLSAFMQNVHNTRFFSVQILWVNY